MDQSCRRCVGCLCSAHRVLGASGDRGQEDSRPTGVIAEIVEDMREIRVYYRFIRLCHGRWDFWCRFAGVKGSAGVWVISIDWALVLEQAL